MNKSKQTITLALAGVLAVGNVGLFVYDNVILKNQEANNKSIIFAAKDDIQQNQKITSDLFMEIEVPNSGLLPTYVTKEDFKKVEGFKVAGGLKKNDILTTMRVSKEEIPEGDYFLEVRPDESVELLENDSATIYFRENKTGEVYVLFKNRLVVGAEDLSQTTTTTNKKQAYKILGSDDDAKLYFKYKLLGDIVIVKHTDTFNADESTIEDYEIKKALEQSN